MDDRPRIFGVPPYAAIVALVVAVISFGFGATPPIAAAQPTVTGPGSGPVPGSGSGSGRIYLAPLGNASSLDYDALAAHYMDRFGLSLTVLPFAELSADQVDPARQQLIAEALINRMRAAYPDLDQDPTALLIGVTEWDMYIGDTPAWRYGFSLRQGRRFAVISSARMNPSNYGEPPDPPVVQTRVQKMITKTLGLQYFGMPMSDDPHSVLYRSILGLDDLDAASEAF